MEGTGWVGNRARASEATQWMFYYFLAQNLTSPSLICKNPCCVSFAGKQGSVPHRESQRPSHCHSPLPCPVIQGLEVEADFGCGLSALVSSG